MSNTLGEITATEPMSKFEKDALHDEKTAIREAKHAAWCEGRDAAAEEVRRQWPGPAVAIVRALQSPYQDQTR